MGSEQASDILVIGYGNELRGDDGAGPAVVRSIEALHLPGLRTLTRHQLTPELAEAISSAQATIFVDARDASQGLTVEALPVVPSRNITITAHRSDPAALAALAQCLFGRCPPSWLVTVPAKEFEFGERLSSLTQHGIIEAVAAVQRLCQLVRHG